MKANNNSYFFDMTTATTKAARDYDKTRMELELASLKRQSNPSEMTRRKIALLERELQ